MSNRHSFKLKFEGRIRSNCRGSTLGNCQDSGVTPVDGMLVIVAAFGWC